MTRRNLTTTAIVAAATLLLYGGVTLAQGQQTRDNQGEQVVASQSPGILEPGDDGANGADDTVQPSASPDDHGGNGADDTVQPSASPDDHGGNGADDGY